MRLIDREELSQKLDSEEDFKLVLREWAYRAKHIPGSLNLDTIEKGLEDLDMNDEVVVYCSNADCVASVAPYKLLSRRTATATSGATRAGSRTGSWLLAPRGDGAVSEASNQKVRENR